MEDILKINSETIKNEIKEQKSAFHGMLLGILAASMLGNILAGEPKIPRRGVIRAGEGSIVSSQGRSTIRVGQGF